MGGCLRDLLRGRIPHDWDVATSARPERVAALFARTLPTGLAYGTVSVQTGVRWVQVTTFRSESSYGDRRHPAHVRWLGEVEGDLARRDFTVNAMALGLDGRLVDPWGGLADLQSGLIRAVGDPQERFAEDPLRVLRGARLAAETGWRMEEATVQAALRGAADLPGVSRERLFSEMNRLLHGGHAAAGVELLWRTGAAWSVLGRAAGELHAEGLRHVAEAVERAPREEAARWLAFLHAFARPAELAARAILPGRPRRAVSELARTLTRLEEGGGPPAANAERVRRLGPAARSLVALLGREQAVLLAGWLAAHPAGCPRPRLAALAGSWARALREVTERGDPCLPADLSLDGSEVASRLGAGGPAVGRSLECLAAWVREDPARNRPELLREHLERECRPGRGPR
ncbi:MAG: tRNA cytidylyltransferase [Clostridia bacterium]|nr:tRNA cytidylyltransferase [Clostridia bacterium]MCL6522050.1 tRNA cytidylyltransferase [Bacillota bacterium]